MSDRLAAYSPYALAFLRIVAALLFIEHGTMKLFGFPAAMPMQISLFSLMGLAALLEICGGLLILLGLFTRPVAFVLSGEMAVAYFMAHAPLLAHRQPGGGSDPLLLRLPLPGLSRCGCIQH